MKRAIRLFGRIAKSHGSPSELKRLRRVANAWDTQITDVRDAIEHIDGDIVNDTGVPEGSAHLLTVSDDGERLEIASHSIALSALHGTIRALHDAGKAMIDALPSPSAAQ